MMTCPSRMKLSAQLTSKALVHPGVSHLSEQASSGNTWEGSGHVHEGGVRDGVSPACLLDLSNGYPHRVHRRSLFPTPILARVLS